MPEHLKIIESDYFGKAQKLLFTNSERSPRNVKYDYMLRNMVNCEQCGSPYHGVNYHGTLYYRCANRHRTFPLPRNCKAGSVKADRLEQAVWDTFTRIIANPELLRRHLSQVEMGLNASTRKHQVEIDRIEKDFEKCGLEETRILDAYRAGIISIDQLKDQIETIKRKKKVLLNEKENLTKGQRPNVTLKEDAINDYCRLISEKVTKASNVDRKYLLSEALNKISINNKVIRIQGVIPCSIASTASGCCVHRRLRPRGRVWRVPVPSPR